MFCRRMRPSPLRAKGKGRGARHRRWGGAVGATGGFEAVVAASLAGAGLPVVVVNPAQVRAFAQALGRRAKTDPVDAWVVAGFVEATRPPLCPLADADQQLLAALATRRRQILQMLTAERQRLSRT